MHAPIFIRLCVFSNSAYLTTKTQWKVSTFEKHQRHVRAGVGQNGFKFGIENK
jgi:hypothetical protein